MPLKSSSPLPLRRLSAAVATVAIFSTIAWLHAYPPQEDPQVAEHIIHRPPNAQVAGRPAVSDPATSGRLKIAVLDLATNEPTFCRINVVGSDGNYYEPDEKNNALWPWSLQRKGNRLGKGPFRYYGWFFYSDGTSEIVVPPGETRVEVWKGLEYEPVGTVVNITAGEIADVRLGISRVADWAARGWHSGDTHIHLDRRNEKDDERALDLAAAEDLRFAHILAMNDPRTYVPQMDQQLHPQMRGMGKASERFRVVTPNRKPANDAPPTDAVPKKSEGQKRDPAPKDGAGIFESLRPDVRAYIGPPDDSPETPVTPRVSPIVYQIVSGQEYRANTYGHICFIGGSRLVEADGMKTNPNNWPPFGVVADELHGIGGFAFHAHGGYGREIYADFAQRATDGVELLQFAEYRDIGLEGWYHILNAGYRFPAIGASDYPYCRALGDCRTYAYLGNQGATFENWNKAVAQGRSFFTTGPLVELVVNGARPGDTLELPAGQNTLEVSLAIHSPLGAAHEMQIIVGGEVERRRIRIGEGYGTTLQTISSAVTLKESSWISARVFSKHKSGKEDIEAHTNPVYVKVGNTSPVRRQSVTWLIKKLDERIKANSARNFDQWQQVIEYLQKSRKVLDDLRTAK